jgi:hypothetical protein
MGYWCFAPIELKQTPGRKVAENVGQVWAWVGDFDDITEEQATHIFKEIKPYAHIIYTTYGHFNGRKKDNTPKTIRIRVILPYSRPVQPSDHKRTYLAGCNWLGSSADEKCAGVQFYFYGPSHAPGAKFLPVFINQGQFLNPSILRGQPVTKEALRYTAQRWKRRKDPTLGVALTSVINGEPYADEGQRDDMAYALADALAGTFPNANPEALASHFAASTALMGSDAPDILEKLDRCFKKKGETPDFRRKQVRDYFLRNEEPGRDDPWTVDELEEIQRQGPWIVNVGSKYYFLTPNGYSRGYLSEEASNSAHQHLAATDIPLLDNSGKYIPLTGLVRSHGTSAKHMIYDMTAQKSAYDVTTGIFTEASSPLRVLTPYYSNAVNEWLICAFKDRAELANRWLALLPEIDKTCSALLITGHPGAGKTLFAHACARLWTEYAPTSLLQILGNFNASLASCPLILADEMIPEGAQGRPKTRELRELIGTRQRVLSKKRELESSLVGAVRVIITANSESILQISESLTQDDSAAIAERIIHLPIHEDGRTYLHKLGQDRVAMFVQNDELASHALWLNKNHQFERVGRFQIKAPDTKLLEMLTVCSGVRSLICRWCITYLSKYQSNPVFSSKAIVQKNNLYVNAGDILDAWKLIMGDNGWPPKIEEVAEALRGLSRPSSKRNSMKRYREVNMSCLQTWAEKMDHDFAERFANGPPVFEDTYYVDRNVS